MAGYFRGSPLHAFEFQPDLQPVIDGPLGSRVSYLQAKWNRTAEVRNSRFQSSLRALDRLIAWAKAERHAFMERLLGVAPARSISPLAQAGELPHVDEISQKLDNLDDEVDSDGCDEDVMADHPRCSFAPNKKVTSDNVQTDGFAVADLETNVFVNDSDVYEAAVALADSLERLGKHENEHVVEDLYKLLAKDVEHIATTEKHVPDKIDSESGEEEPEVEQEDTPHAGKVFVSQAASSSSTTLSDIVDPNVNHAEKHSTRHFQR